MPGEAARPVHGTLTKRGAARFVRLDGELEPGPSGHLHLGAKPHEARGETLLDPPEVHCLADPKGVRVAAAPTQADTARDPVDEPADFPQQPSRVPAVVAADAVDGGPEVRRRGGRAEHANVLVQGAPGPVGVAREGV